MSLNRKCCIVELKKDNYQGTYHKMLYWTNIEKGCEVTLITLTITSEVTLIIISEVTSIITSEVTLIITSEVTLIITRANMILKSNNGQPYFIRRHCSDLKRRGMLEKLTINVSTICQRGIINFSWIPNSNRLYNDKISQLKFSDLPCKPVCSLVNM